MENTILILGDSTSMSMGLENKMYSFLIAKKEVWPKNYQIINYKEITKRALLASSLSK